MEVPRHCLTGLPNPWSALFVWIQSRALQYTNVKRGMGYAAHAGKLSKIRANHAQSAVEN